MIFVCVCVWDASQKLIGYVLGPPPSMGRV